jgi:hypothetical protein
LPRLAVCQAGIVYGLFTRLALVKLYFSFLLMNAEWSGSFKKEKHSYNTNCSQLIVSLQLQLVNYTQDFRRKALLLRTSLLILFTCAEDHCLVLVII